MAKDTWRVERVEKHKSEIRFYIIRAVCGIKTLLRLTLLANLKGMGEMRRIDMPV